METTTKDSYDKKRIHKKVIAYADDGTMFFDSARAASEFTKVTMKQIYASIARGTVYDGWSFNWYEN